ncbi:hypothetical protein [Halobacillus aidingensis]|uniref:Uncharacterized protein n=1 Tax=Halobacillus aidingensis TaxID=240303 RepID=A0A1H0LIA5_HALAD|nr:hypothetical protein [Halobacillus aidingensis]SDO67978.1 hypothetical protein SAMN05421677_10733 [Halobacillus aidingensis]
MLEFFMLTITAVLVAGYIYVIYTKRKKLKKDYGWKSYVTPGAFVVAPLVALFSYLFEFGGMITWFILGICFITGAFFTKYLPEPREG